MKNPCKVIIIVIGVLFAVNGSGCGLRPSTNIPSGVTESEVVDALRMQSDEIRDFTGKAFARAQAEGREDTATLQIAYRRPERFKTVIKGTFGIIFAIVTMNPDSLNMYIPSENGYIIVERIPGQTIMQLPGIDFDLQRFTSYFTGVLPPQDILVSSDVILLRTDDGGDLVVNTGQYSYRYHVTGDELRLTEYEIYRGRDMIWRMTCSGYRTWDGGVFPRKMTLAEPGQELELEFSDCVINSGLDEKDVTFNIPRNAERLIVKPTGSDLP